MNINRRQFFAGICATVATAALKPVIAVAELNSARVEGDPAKLAKAEALREYDFYTRSWDYSVASMNTPEQLEYLAAHGHPKMQLNLVLVNGDFAVYTRSLEPSDDVLRRINNKKLEMQPVKVTWTDEFLVEGQKIDYMDVEINRTIIDVTAFGDESRRYVYGLRG